jgi:hypothetical protein
VPCSHLPVLLLQAPRHPLALQAHLIPPRHQRNRWFPIMATTPHLHTPSRRLAKAPRCRRRRSPSRLIISIIRLPDIPRIGPLTTAGPLDTRPRRRQVLPRRPSAPARWRPAWNPTSKPGTRARIIAWGHRSGSMNAPHPNAASFCSPCMANYTVPVCCNSCGFRHVLFFFAHHPMPCLFVRFLSSSSFGSPQYACIVVVVVVSRSSKSLGFRALLWMYNLRHNSPRRYSRNIKHTHTHTYNFPSLGCPLFLLQK